MLLPRKIRKLIALLRGQISPVLAGLSVGLGIWFGLMPGFQGMHASLLILLVLLNVPIGLFITFAVLGKALALAIAPVLHHTGLFVINHLGVLIDVISKIPIAAVTDFSNTARAGALLIGPCCGAIVGFLFAQTVLGFRKTWLKLESNSEKFNAWQQKKWVKILDRIIIGKRSKDAKSTLEAKTKYIRKGGAILAVILILVFGIGAFFAKDKIKSQTAQTLSKANGATVDIAALSLSPMTGHVAVKGLDVADKDNLNQNKLQIEEFSAKASVYQLSLGKLVLDQVKVSALQFDQPRETPAQLVEKTQSEDTKETKQFDPKEYQVDANSINTLGNYVKNAQKVKEWIDKIRPWLPEGKDKKPVPVTEPHKYLDYLRTQVDVMPAVRLLAKDIVLDKVGLENSIFAQSTIQLKNLNDAPMAAKLPVSFDLTSEQGAHLDMTLHFDDPAQPGKVTGSFSSIDLAKLQSGLSNENALNFQSGQANGTIEGTLNRNAVDLALNVKLTDLQTASTGKGLFGLDAKTTSDVFDAINELNLTLRIVGPVTEPRIAFDTKNLQETLQAKLVDMGRQKAADELNKVIDKELGDQIPDDIKDAVDTDAIKEGLKGLLGGKKEE